MCLSAEWRVGVILVWGSALFLLGAAGWSASVEPIGNMVTDVVVGRNNKGPYYLSWTQIDPKSVSAVINGRTLGRGEFAMDNSNGTVSFSSVLLRDAIVRFNYTITPKSKRNAGTMNIPMTLKVFNKDDASIQVTGIHVVSDAKKPDVGKTIVGVSGDRKWASGKVTSQLLVSQEDQARPGEQGSGMDRSVLKVGAEAASGSFTFAGSLMNAGDKFSGEKEYGIAAGRRESDFAVRFAPDKRVEASASFKAAENTAGKQQGTGSVVLEQSLAVSPNDTTRISLRHSTTESQTAAVDSEKQVETSSVSIDQRVGDATKATLSMSHTATESAGSSEDTTVQKLSVTSKPVENVNVSAQIEQKNSDTRGEELSTSAALEVKPAKDVLLQATHATLQSATSGVATDTSVALKAAAPGNTEVKLSLLEKNSADLTKYQRDVSIASRPTSYARFSGVFSQKGLNDQDDVTRGAALELTPFSHTRLGGGYKYIETGASVMTIAEYSASSRPWGCLEFSGSYRDREARGDAALDSAALQVALAPRKDFSLTANYEANPEDKKGAVQTYEATTVGAKMRFGSVGLSAGLTQKDDTKLLQSSEERSLSVDLPAFGSGRLTTGYKAARLFGSTEQGSDTYTLGYRMDVGDTFNLVLAGRYTQFRGSTTDPNSVEYGADASLGIRF